MSRAFTEIKPVAAGNWPELDKALRAARRRGLPLVIGKVEVHCADMVKLWGAIGASPYNTYWLL